MLRLTLTFKGNALKVYDTDKNEVTIGRDEKNDIPLDNIGISKRHARIVRKEAGYWIQDLDSTNGTLLNGQKVRTAQLADGDTLEVLKFALKVSLPRTQVGSSEPSAEIPPTYKL
jgi:pSer/pThr/pTyr-binding forkhead associated (FHA) protein